MSERVVYCYRSSGFSNPMRESYFDEKLEAFAEASSRHQFDSHGRVERVRVRETDGRCVVIRRQTICDSTDAKAQIRSRERGTLLGKCHWFSDGGVR